MAVTSVDEIKGRRRSSQDSLWRRTYTRVYRVQTDDPSTDALTVRTASGLPSIGNTYSVGSVHDYGAFVQSIEASEETEDGKSWIVTVEYGPYDAGQFPSNPVQWPLRVSFSQQKYELAVGQDRNGNAILNSAKDPYKDPVTIDQSRTIITAVRNEPIASFDLTLAESYYDKVNSATWNGFTARTVKLDSITTSQPQYDSNNQIYYFEVTYTFAVKRDKWNSKILDSGFNELDSSSPARQQPVRDAQGQPVTEAVPLDGSGHRLATSGSPVFTEYEIYDQADFSVFNMDFNSALGR